MGGASRFLLGGGQRRGQGAGHVGADISHGRAFDGCMDDNWGEQLGGQARARRAAAPPAPPLEPPMQQCRISKFSGEGPPSPASRGGEGGVDGRVGERRGEGEKGR